MGYNSINAQQIKELKYFYTDSNKYNPSSINLTRIYYKDINNYFTPFLGQWKYTNGNKTFIVTLWKETKNPTFYGYDEPIFYCDLIFGHYTMYQDYGLPTQLILYTSQTNIGLSSDTWDTIISGKVVKQNELSGMINDIHSTPLNPTQYPQGLKGYLSMTINPSTSTATWHIGNTGALFGTNEPRNFTIPTDIVLTKI